MNVKHIISDLAGIHGFFKSIFNHTHISDLNLPINVTQEKVLMFIKHCKINNMSKISKMTGIEKGSFTTSADHLIKLGLVERTRSQTDRRTISLNLTEEGNKLTEKIIDAVDEYVEDMVALLEEDEKQDFIEALQVITKCIYKIERKGD